MTNLKKRERAKTNASLISMVQRFSDITIMFAGLWLVCEVSGRSFFYMHLLVALITLVVFQMLGGITDFYRSWRGVRATTEFALLLQNWTLSVIFSAGLVAFNNDFDTQLKVWLAWYLLTSIGLVVCRSCIRIGAGWLRNHGYNKRMVAVAGDLAAGQMLIESFRNQPWLGFEVVGVYHDPKPGGVSNDWAGNLQQLVEDAKAGKIHNVYIAMQMCDGARVKKLVHALADTTCSVLLIPDVFTFNILHSRIEEMNGVPVVPLYDTPLSGVNRLIKRAEDIVLATLILLLISPVLCCIALAVKLSSPGPIIFRQTRYGMDGKPIKVWKFRSMKVMENDNVVTQATQNDPRVTRVGNFLRRTSLDELPQFINVLTGGMSIVGPRPHAVAHNEQYRQLIEGYMLRHKVKPGITGWAQINGWRGETDTLEKMEKRVEFDLEYIREWSVWFDIRIVFLTVFKGFVNKAAYVYGETKLAGEKALQEHCAKHLIFRTSWVYAGKGNNFAKTMLRLAKEREELAVINDQFGAPTGAELLADCTAHAIRVAVNKPEVAGLYHLVAGGTTTWHDYAALVFEEARKAGINLALNKLNAVPTSAYPTPARRPHNSRLNTEKFQQNFALVLPEWQVGVKRMLNELFTTTAI